jgi:5-methylcytosine-specific restriction endonuclease McrA
MTDPFYNLSRWKRIRVEAKRRDGHQCVVCGAAGVRLDVDHVIPWKGTAARGGDI